MRTYMLSSMLAFLIFLAPASYAAPADEIDAFIETTLGEFKEVPGLAVAVVMPDGPVFVKGYGRTRLDRHGAPVTPDTPFYSASVTKAVTSLMAHRMADHGMIDLEQTLSEAAPSVRFPASIHPEHVQLIDLINLRHGFFQDGAEFRLAYSGKHDPETLAMLWERLTPNPDAEYGEFAYGNISFNLATWIIEAQIGQQWRELVSTHVLDPLNMDTATTQPSTTAQEKRVLSYLSFSPDYPAPVALQKHDNTMHSAGGLMASASDLAKFIQLQLGALAGQATVIPADIVLRTHDPVTEVDAEFAGIKRTAYGHGWYTGIWDGARILHCFGQFGGARAHVSFSPDESIGVVVLTNDGGYGAFLADEIARYAYDVSREAPDRSERASTRLRELRVRGDTIRASNLAKAGERAIDAYNLSASISAYIGKYSNNDFGEFALDVEDDRIIASSGHVVLEFTPTGRDDVPTDIVRYQLLYHGGYARFSVTDGKATSMQLLGDPFNGAEFLRLEN